MLARGLGKANKRCHIRNKFFFCISSSDCFTQVTIRFVKDEMRCIGLVGWGPGGGVCFIEFIWFLFSSCFLWPEIKRSFVSNLCVRVVKNMYYVIGPSEYLYQGQKRPTVQVWRN